MSSNRIQRCRTISITSGKGGVGKTTVACNLAWILAQKKRRVLVLDGDWGLANAELFFGTKSRGTLLEVLHAEKSIDQVLTPVANGIDLLAGGSGLVELTRLSRLERKSLIDAVIDLEYRYDDIIIDTAPGISDQVLYLNAAVEIPVLVLTPDPASFADSYALMKVMSRDFKSKKFAIFANQVADTQEGIQLYSRFSEVVSRFLPVGLDYWGAMPLDSLLRRSNQAQRLIVRQDPTNVASMAMRQMAEHLPAPNLNRDSSPFFWEQVMGVA